MSEFTESVHIWFPGALVMLALVLCSAFFSASETAFFFLTREQIRRFSTGNRRQKMVAALLADPDRLLTAVLFWNLLINLAYFTVGVVVMQKLNARNYNTVAAAIGLLNLLGMIVLGEVLPKSTAVVFKQRISVVASWPLAAAVAVLDPIIPFLGRLARLLRRSLWPHVQHEPPLQAEDLERAIDASVATTTELLEIEQQVLHNILDLNEVTVEEVMRPRNLVTLVDPADTLETATIVNLPNTDYLLIRDEGEDICRQAVALSKITGEASRTFGDLAEPVIYVPWCSSLAYVLSEMRNQYRSVAVVVHEHGEMVGVVSYEDLLETTFSDSPSRTRRVLGREPVIEIDSNRFHAEGLVTLRYLYRHLRIPYDADEDNQTTLAGLFHDSLERLPEVGDRITEEGWIFTAIEVSPQGQVRALIEPEDYSVSATGGEQ